MQDFLIRKFHPLLNVAIEPTNDCNMNCNYCYRKERKVGYMDFDLFTSLIDQLPQRCRVGLSFGGESILHPQFRQMVHYAAAHKFRDLNVYSNGSVDYEGLPIRVVVNPKPPKIVFSKDFKLPAEHDLEPQYDWCRSLYCYMAILWNGDVVPCCYDVAGRKVLGNVKNKSIKTMWNDDAYKLLRSQGSCYDCELYKYVSDETRGQVFLQKEVRE
jgi:MoaA/NifB/PqqE/SkfB family radical SAM enzyme